MVKVTSDSSLVLVISALVSELLLRKCVNSCSLNEMWDTKTSLGSGFEGCIIIVIIQSSELIFIHFSTKCYFASPIHEMLSVEMHVCVILTCTNFADIRRLSPVGSFM